MQAPSPNPNGRDYGIYPTFPFGFGDIVPERSEW
jgi:hypothetical protein